MPKIGRDPNSQRSKDGRVDVGRQRIRHGSPPNRRDKGTKDNPWHETTRERIRASSVVKKLIACAEGEDDAEMTTVQARVALGLIDKVLPTLTENKTEVSGEIVIERRRLTDPDPNT